MKNTSCHGQRGVLLLEVLIALLIFSLGVLGLVGLQASAAKQSGQTKYRADATLLANDLVGQMRLTSNNFSTLKTRFQSAATAGADYVAWKARVVERLPGADAYPPIVTLTEVQPLNAIVEGASAPSTGLTSSTQVTVTVRWKAAGEPTAGAAHSIVLTNEIR